MATSGYTTYNANGTVKSFTPAATYKAQVASDISSGKDTAPGVSGTINQNVVGAPTAGAPITSAALAPAPAYTPPTPAPASNINTNAMTAVGAQNSVYQTALASAAAAQDKATSSTSGTDSLASQLALMAGIPQKQDVLSIPEVTAAHNQMVSAQNQTNQDTALLNAIITKQNQDLLQTRGTASANGVTEAVYGGQANEINREAAIQSLPISAKIAIDQGNLRVAQDNLTYMTSVVQEKVNNAYDHQTAVYNSVSSFVNKSEAVILDARKTQAANNFTLQRDAIGQASDYAKLATTNGQGQIAHGLMSAMGAISALNTASPTYAADLKSAQANVAALAGQIHGKTSNQIIGSADTGYTNVVTDAQGKVISSTPIGGGKGGTPSGDPYASIAQEAINADASPQQALDEAINMAATRGNTLTIAQQNTLYKKILEMKKAAVQPPPPTAEPAVATAPLSKIEQDIATAKTRYSYNTTELKQLLLTKGYSIEEITKSSAGSFFDKAGNTIRSLFGG